MNSETRSIVYRATPVSKASKRVRIYPILPVSCLLTRVYLLALNVIRMVKFFGWEQRMAEQLNEKRMDELASVRKQKLLSLFNSVVK